MREREKVRNINRIKMIREREREKWEREKNWEILTG